MVRVLMVVVVALALAGCASDPSPSPSPSASETAASQSPAASASATVEPSSPPFVTDSSSSTSGGALGATTVRQIRVARHASFDRLVLDLAGPGPVWQADYVDRLTNDGSGDPAPINGVRNLSVVVQAMGYDVDTGNPVYRGLRVARPRLTTLKAWAVTGDFEGQFTVGLALNSDAAYRVFTLDSPTRLVIDVKHPN